MEYSIVDNKEQQNSESKKSRKVAFHAFSPEWDLDEIVLSTEVRKTLEDVVSFCVNKPKIVEEWELHRFLKGAGGCTGINFWGIPGTGKSIAAEAIAKAMKKRVIHASLNSLLDSLQGNTEKNISELFETAVAEDCVIIFDEADGLLSARKSGSANSDTINLIKSHMLNLLDRSSAIVVFTTNFFKSYDRAFVRRILWNIEFKAPEKDELVKIWQLHLGKNIPREISYDNLSDLTINKCKERNIQVTGGDIRKLTLMFCTQLTSGRCDAITAEVADQVISRYLNDLQENVSPDTRGQVVDVNKLPKGIREELK